ncbi:MAG: hypothetical protein RIA69_16170 [Cyclobacteriaceae bacterium]
MRFLPLIFVLTFIACTTSNTDVINKLDNFNNQAEQELTQRREGFNKLVEESFYDESERAQEINRIYDILDSLTIEISEATSSNELSKLINSWNTFFGTELTLAAANDLELQKRLTSLDIRLKAKEFVDKTTIKVGGGPIKFDILNFYVTTENTEIELGESTEVKLTFAAVPGNIDVAFDILLNGDTINTKKGQGIYQFTPTRKGTFEFKGSIQAKPGMRMLEGWKMEDKVKIVVK